MAGNEGQARLTPQEAGVLPVDVFVNAHVGNTATSYDKATYGGTKKILVLHAKKGNWNYRVGDVAVSMPGVYEEAATITTGTASLGLTEGETRVMAAPDEFTVEGYGADPVLVWYFV